MRSRKFLGAVLAVGLVATLAGCSDPARKEAKYIKSGIALFEKGDYSKARLEFRNAARIKPTDPEVRYRLGLVDEAEGDLRNAFVNFRRAEEQDGHFRPALMKVAQYLLGANKLEEVDKRLDVLVADAPDAPEVRALKAALLLRRKDFEASEREAKFALDKDPGNPAAASVLTGLYVAEGKPERAGQVLESAIARHPRNVSLHQLQVTLYKRLNDLDRLEGAYRALFPLQPANALYRLDLARLLKKAGHSDRAEAVLREGVAAAPDELAMKSQLVAFLNEEHGLESAEKEIKGYIQADPKRDAFYFWLADLYLKHREDDRAVALLQQVASSQRYEAPGLTARASIARINLGRGQTAQAERLIADVLDKNPTNPDALFLRATIAFERGHYQAVVADLRTILRDHPKTRNVYPLLGEALARQGRVDLAVETLSQLMALDPTNLAARVRLAQMQHLNRNSTRAMEELDTASTLDPQYPVAWETKARIAIDLKDWATADAAIARLAKLRGQKLTAVFLAGVVRAGTGKPDEGIKDFVQVIDADPNAPLAEHAMTALVKAYAGKGQLDSAARYLAGLAVASPIGHTILGDAYLLVKKPDLAAEQYERALVDDPKRPEPYVARARLDLANGKPDRAIELLQRGSAAVPADLRMPMMLADLQAARGRFKEAEALYDDLLTRDPSLDTVANNLAEMIADHFADSPAALDKARRLSERFIASDNPLFLDTLAWVYVKLEQKDQALPILERISAIPGIPAQIHYHYAKALLLKGDNEKARAELEAAVKTAVPYSGLDDARKLLGEAGK